MIERIKSNKLNKNKRFKINSNIKNRIIKNFKIELKYNDVYEKYPILKKYKEILWEISEKDIIWEWYLAYIVVSKKQWMVYKILKNDSEINRKRMLEEFKSHESFLRILKQWQVEWVIPDYIKIPAITRHPKDLNNMFWMEYIDWISLYNIRLIDDFRDELTKEEIEMLMKMSDRQITIYIEKKLNLNNNLDEENEFDYDLDKLDNIEIWEDIIWSNKNSINQWFWNSPDEFILLWKDPLDNDWFKKLKYTYSELINWIESTLKYFYKNWIMHNDLHPWNIMIKLDENMNPICIYIIDFWTVIRDWLYFYSRFI